VVLNIAFETNSVLRLKSLVSAGLALAVLPNSDASGPGPSVASVPLRRPALQHVVHLAWRKGRRNSPAAAAFIRLLDPSHPPSSSHGTFT
jgi:DNA-binding transcriptional LysR family regulator